MKIKLKAIILTKWKLMINVTSMMHGPELKILDSCQTSLATNLLDGGPRN